MQAEGLPPPKVEWFKQKTTTGADQIQHEEIQQIHTNNRVSIFSDEFGDSFMTVRKETAIKNDQKSKAFLH